MTSYLNVTVFPPDANDDPFEKTFELEPSAPWIGFLRKHLDEGCYLECWQEQA